MAKKHSGEGVAHPVRRHDPAALEAMPLATLKGLRKGAKRTQEDLAKTLGVGQDTISRLEKRSDMLLSTLRHYVESVGGRLAWVATFPEQRAVSIDHLGENRPVKKRGDGRGKAAADEPEAPDARDDSNPLLPDR